MTAKTLSEHAPPGAKTITFSRGVAPSGVYGMFKWTYWPKGSLSGCLCNHPFA